MLKIEVLPAHHGDSVLVTWGTSAKPHRLLIDGGTESSANDVAARLAKIGKPAPLELALVTHVDEDHIGGMLKLMIAKAFTTKDFWFNTYADLTPPDKLGGVMGEGLSQAIEDAGFKRNHAWKGQSVVVPDKGPLPSVTIEGATITLLSPTWAKLEALQPKWLAECKKAHIVAGEGVAPEDALGKHAPPTNIDVDELLKVPFKQDASAANGSCIAFLFEYGGKRVLFGADAHPGVVLESLKRLSPKAPVKLDAFKLCHHGSRNNTSTQLLDHVDCTTFLVSSNGETFGHPDPETLARVVSREKHKTVCFNYDSEYTQPWNRQALRDKYAYDVQFPDGDGTGYVLDL